MKTKPYNLLLHPAFLLSLALLLLNDFYFKEAFHNSITGKLSDVAGLFTFATFFIIFFPRYKKTVLIIIALFFIWWKSPLSNLSISFINDQFHLPVHRIIDYTDLFALAILPFVLLLKPVYYAPVFIRRIAIGCIGFISFTAFTATSMLRRIADDNKIYVYENIRTKKTETEIVEAIKQKGLTVRLDSAFYDKVWDENYVRIYNADSSFRMVAISSLYPGVYSKIGFGSQYTIPRWNINGDTVYNVELTVTKYSKRKTEVDIHSYRHVTYTSPLNYTGRNSGKKIKKKLKAIIK